VFLLLHLKGSDEGCSRRLIFQRCLNISRVFLLLHLKGSDEGFMNKVVLTSLFLMMFKYKLGVAFIVFKGFIS